MKAVGPACRYPASPCTYRDEKEPADQSPCPKVKIRGIAAERPWSAGVKKAREPMAPSLNSETGRRLALRATCTHQRDQGADQHEGR
jgi:hypothetical protein